MSLLIPTCAGGPDRRAWPRDQCGRGFTHRAAVAENVQVCEGQGVLLHGRETTRSISESAAGVILVLRNGKF